MQSLVGDTTGLIHLISSCFALIFGTMILILPKGTKRHKQVGYGYILSMTVLIVTAFMIYRLFNGWGIFHYLTVVSLVSLLGGMVPIWTKWPKNSWQDLHFSFMYWSVMGLYAAFASEIITRVPDTPFFGMLGIATGGIMFVAAWFYYKYRARWARVFTRFQQE